MTENARFCLYSDHLARKLKNKKKQAQPKKPTTNNTKKTKKKQRQLWELCGMLPCSSPQIFLFCFFWLFGFFGYVCFSFFCFFSIWWFLVFFGCVFTGFATYPASIQIIVNIRMLRSPKNAGRTWEQGDGKGDGVRVGGVPCICILGCLRAGC